MSHFLCLSLCLSLSPSLSLLLPPPVPLFVFYECLYVYLSLIQNSHPFLSIYLCFLRSAVLTTFFPPLHPPSQPPKEHDFCFFRNVSKCYQNVSKMLPNCSLMLPECSQSAPKILKKCSKNYTKTSKSASKCSKIAIEMFVFVLKHNVITVLHNLIEIKQHHTHSWPLPAHHTTHQCAHPNTFPAIPTPLYALQLCSYLWHTAALFCKMGVGKPVLNLSLETGIRPVLFHFPLPD